jgi:hypothetical protein
MPFITQGKANLKYILIVVILAAIAGGGILGYQYWWAPRKETTQPEVKLLKKEPLVETSTKSYLNKSYGYGFQYPDDFQLVTLENIDALIEAEMTLSDMKRTLLDVKSLGILEEGGVALIEKNNENITYLISIPSSLKGSSSFDEYLALQRSNKSFFDKKGIAFIEKEITFGKNNTKGIEFSFEMEYQMVNKERLTVFHSIIFEHGKDYYSIDFIFPKDIDGSKYIKVYNDILDSFYFEK